MHDLIGKLVVKFGFTTSCEPVRCYDEHVVNNTHFFQVTQMSLP
jgi:hypothetical protein